MLKNVLLAVAAAWGCSVFLCSCTGSDNATTVSTSPEALNQLFATLRATPQYVYVTAGTDTVIYGADSTEIHFYANTFVDESNNPITSGAILINLAEMYKPGDFVLNRASTITSNGVMSASGAINIIATQNGQAVSAYRYGVAFRQASASAQPVQLYYGNTNNPDSVTTWTINSAASGTSANTTRDSIDHTYTGTQYYGFDSCSQFGAVACGYTFSTSAQLADITLDEPSVNYTASNTEAYMLIPSANVVFYFSVYDANNNTFSTQTVVPVGMNYEMAMISNISGYIYFEQSGTVTSGLSIAAAPTAATWASLVTAVDHL